MSKGLSYCISLFLACYISFTCVAQSAYSPLNQDYSHLIERYEIKRGTIISNFHSEIKPYTRKMVVELVDTLLKDQTANYNEKDLFNLYYLQNDNWEWTNPEEGNSTKNLWGVFYHKKSDAYHIHNDDLDLHINPVFNFEVGAGSGTNKSMTTLNTRGIEIRGMINRKISFYTFMTDNLTAVPDYVRNYVDSYNGNPIGGTDRISGMPGEGLVKEYRQDGFVNDFITAKAYISFQATKNVDIQFGHDKNFIGNGFRSTILSDNSAPYLFLKINTNVGRFQYQNLFAQLTNPQFSGPISIYPKKYLAMHHLSINASKKLNFGFTESIIFKRDSTNGGNSGFDLNYLNPVIFYRFAETFNGSGDNALLAIDFKWNFAKQFSLYGQWMLDEFVMKEIVSSRGSWTNKNALQLGLKYIDAFNIPNLDYQVEYNVARPYTYSHKNNGISYSHYNQALAHPLGANFRELVQILRYQFSNKLNFVGTFLWAVYGEDTNNSNWGKNILLDYEKRSRLVQYNDNYGNTVAQGAFTALTFLDLRLSYQVKHNLFLELHHLTRNQSSTSPSLSYNNSVTSFGIRCNIAPRIMIF
ncbi:MAG: hypothetical protein ACOVOW_17665 [Spirosomataceae bacterium]